MEKTKETVDYVIAKLNGIGEALSPYAKEGWEILIRQQYIKFFQIAGVLLFASIVCLVMALVAKRFYAKCFKDGKDDWDSGSNYLQGMTIVPTVISCIAGAAVITLSIVTVVNISLLLNPEYYAIKLILKGTMG